MTDLLSRGAGVTSATADGELVSAYLGGDELAGEELIARFHHRLVDRMLGWSKGRDDAEDLAQETWTLVFRALDRFDTTAPMWPWLRSIGDNAARSRLRRTHPTGVRRETSWTPGLLEVAAGPTDDETGASDDVDMIKWCWGQLSPGEQAILRLVDVDDVSHQHAAAVLEMTPAGFRQRLCRARRRLRELGQTLAGLPLFRWAQSSPGQLVGEAGQHVLVTALLPVLVVTAAVITASVRSEYIAPQETAVVPAESSWTQDDPQALDGSEVPAATARFASATVAPAPPPSTGDTSAPPVEEIVVPSTGPAMPESQTPVPGTDRTVRTGEPEELDYSYGVDVLRDDHGNPLLATQSDDPEAAAIDAQACGVATSTPLTYCDRGQ